MSYPRAEHNQQHGPNRDDAHEDAGLGPEAIDVAHFLGPGDDAVQKPKSHNVL